MRKSVRRASLILALTPLVSAPMTMAAFAVSGSTNPTTTVTTTTPAPAGAASASAVDVGGIISVGKTAAHADDPTSSPSTAHADALDLLGTRVAGGDQSGVGSKDGNLIGTGTTPLGDAEVAPWSAKVTHNGDGYQSQAEAALAHLNLGGILELWLLHSKSSATWTPDKSTGSSSSDGAEVSALGQLDIKVLHSEAHSGQTGKSDLLVINGQEIGSSSQANGQCQINAEPLLSLLCLTASGGTSSTGVTTSGGTVAQVDVGNGQLGGVVSGSKSSGGVAVTPQAPQQPKLQHKPASHGNQTEGSRVPNTPAAPSAAGLPFTGADVERMGAIATALAALGGAMTAFGRRRRTSLAH